MPSFTGNGCIKAFLRKYVFRQRWKRLFIGFIDLVGSCIFFKKRQFSANKKILVLRLDQIGDFIQAIPFLEALKKKYPESEIHVLCVKTTEFLVKNIFKTHVLETSWFYTGQNLRLADIFKMITVLKREKYDLAFDLRGDLRNILFLFLSGVKNIIGYGCAGGGFLLSKESDYDREEHEIDKNFKLIDEKPPDEIILDFYLPDTDTFAGKDKIIVIHPFARDKSRMWGFKNYNELAQKILNQNHEVSIFIIGSKEDKKSVINFKWNHRLIDLTGKNSIYSTIGIIKKCNVFIGNNSGMQYFASYSGIRTCVIYGFSTPYKRWVPKVKKENFIFFAKPLECGPCELKECPDILGHACMKAITVDEVFESIKKWL